MNRRILNRELRKELLRLQSEQYRRALAEEFRAIAPLWRAPDATDDSGAAVTGSVLLSKLPLLAATLLPSRWRKWLTYGLALGKVMLVFHASRTKA